MIIFASSQNVSLMLLPFSGGHADVIFQSTETKSVSIFLILLSHSHTFLLGVDSESLL